MRGIYGLEAISKDITGPIIRRVLGTYAAFSCIFILLMCLGIFISFSKVFSIEILKQSGTIIIVWISLVSAISFFVLNFILKDALFPISKLSSWASEASQLEKIAIPGNTSNEVVTVYKVFNNAVGRLKEVQDKLISAERDAAVTKTMQMLAHDVRKPFSSLRMALNTLKMMDDPAEARDFARMILPRIEHNIRGIDEMFADVMTFGAEIHIRAESVSLVEMVTCALERVSSNLQSKSVEVIQDLDSKQCLNVDRAKTLRVLTNLLDNAFHAVPEGGVIRISGRVLLSGEFEVIIFNSGSYISPEERAQVFKPFHSGTSSGTGLGLFIARQFVDAHGGRIYCLSEKQKGTSFIFSIPAPSVQPTVLGAKKNTLKRVAIVDDDSFLLAAWKLKIPDIDCFISPEALLEKLQSGERWDLVLTDYYFDNSKAFNGASLQQRISSAYGIPVILASDGTFSNKTLAGFAAHIEKLPIDRSELEGMVG